MSAPSYENSRHPRCNGDDGDEVAFHGTSSAPQDNPHLHFADNNSAAGFDHLLPHVPEGQEDTHQRVVERMLTGDREVIYAFRWGHGVGQQSTVDRLDGHAEAEAAVLLAYFAEDGLTVPPVPPLKNDWRSVE